MDNFNLDFLVKQKLQEYDNLKELNISNDWETKLNLKLKRGKPASTVPLQYSLILVILIAINISFIMFSIIQKQENDSRRTQDLKVVNNEILISQNN
jgi:ribosomal protein L14E/L6E/L27E